MTWITFVEVQFRASKFFFTLQVPSLALFKCVSMNINYTLDNPTDTL
jgi:hypothetical protein